jgi:membrane-bound lytic murein transglycosylase D
MNNRNNSFGDSRKRVFYLMAMTMLMASGWLIAQTAHHLPYRAELDVDVRFWKQVFTRYSSNQFLIHDSEQLDKIYKVVTVDTSLSEREVDKILKAEIEKVEALLRQFHEKTVDVASLTVEENNIFIKFLHDNTPDKFLRASKNVRAQRGIKENFMAGAQRMFAYLPYIRRIFREYEIPEALVYLPHVESSFNPNARSHVGALGMWQFMRRTGRQYMKVNRIKDERLDPLKSTVAAAKLLSFNYRILQDWALAITAYNHGLGSMTRAKKHHGDYLSIREQYLRRSFGFASKNFYPEVLAVVEICDSLEHYFPNLPKEPVWEFVEIKLPKQVRLNTFARQFQINISALQKLNPGFAASVWNGQRSVPENYTLRLPLSVDALGIVAELGGSPQAAEEIVVVQGINNNEEILIRRLSEVYAHRAKVQKLVRQQRFDVASPDPSTYPQLPEALVALEENVPLTKNEPVIAAKQPEPDVSLPLLAGVGERRQHLKSPYLLKDNEASVYDWPEEWISLTEMPELPGKAAIKEVGQPAQVVQAGIGSGWLEKITDWRLFQQTAATEHNDIKQLLLQRLMPKGNVVIVMPRETLGHFAEWLKVDIAELRRINNLQYNDPLKLGARLKLPPSYVSTEAFLETRLNYHLKILKQYFPEGQKAEFRQYVVQSGDNLWKIARKNYRFPVNLLLYFNELDKLEKLIPGDRIVIPVILQ